MSNNRAMILPEEDTAGSRLNRKARDSPFMVVGLLGLVGALGYSAYKYRSARKAGMSTSVFLMQTRVIAQGTVVGCLSVGLAFQMFDKWILHHGDDE